MAVVAVPFILYLVRFCSSKSCSTRTSIKQRRLTKGRCDREPGPARAGARGPGGPPVGQPPAGLAHPAMPPPASAYCTRSSTYPLTISAGGSPPQPPACLLSSRINSKQLLAYRCLRGLTKVAARWSSEGAPDFPATATSQLRQILLRARRRSQPAGKIAPEPGQ